MSPIVVRGRANCVRWITGFAFKSFGRIVDCLLKSFNGKLIKLLYLCLATHACDNLNRQQVESTPKTAPKIKPSHNDRCDTFSAINGINQSDSCFSFSSEATMCEVRCWRREVDWFRYYFPLWSKSFRFPLRIARHICSHRNIPHIHPSTAITTSMPNRTIPWTWPNLGFCLLFVRPTNSFRIVSGRTKWAWIAFRTLVTN